MRLALVFCADFTRSAPLGSLSGISLSRRDLSSPDMLIIPPFHSRRQTDFLPSRAILNVVQVTLERCRSPHPALRGNLFPKPRNKAINLRTAVPAQAGT